MKEKLRVDIAVICYNEAKNIPSLVEDLSRLVQSIPAVDLRIVIVNNGSTDATADVISQLEKEYSFIHHYLVPVNQGFGYGVHTGLQQLSGDVVGFMCGDNQFDTRVLVDMIKTFMENPDAQLVKTYRTKRYDGPNRLFISKIFQYIFKVLYGVYTRDINASPKLFRTDFLKKLQPLHSDDWFIDAEVMIKAGRNCTPAQIVEIPILFYPRKFGKSNVRLSTCFQFLFNLFKFKFVNL